MNKAQKHKISTLFGWKEQGQGVARCHLLEELRHFTMDNGKTKEASRQGVMRTVP